MQSLQLQKEYICSLQAQQHLMNSGWSHSSKKTDYSVFVLN